MKKATCILLISLLLVISLTGCAKCVSVVRKEVEVEVVDAFYSPTKITPVRVGKVWTYPVVPEKFEITVRYGGTARVFDNQFIYKRYKDKVGSSVIGILETTPYDNGYIEVRIAALK